VIGNARAEQLRVDVTQLGRVIGERNAKHYEQLEQAAFFIEAEWRKAGYSPSRQEYEVNGRRFANLEIELPGAAAPREIIMLGAHYDSAPGSPGANDNGSAIATLLDIARAFSGRRFRRTLRLVAFTNEEQPFTRTRHMGSRVYAKLARRRRDQIKAMIGLENIGCRSNREGSQRLSFHGRLLPSRGDFIAMVANRRSRYLLDPVRTAFQQQASIGCAALVLPSFFPGAWSSDHWSFWREGFPAIMLTDTALLRYRYYHTPEDTPEKLDYDFLSLVTAGLESVLTELAGIDRRRAPRGPPAAPVSPARRML
jgi:Zn-dependent M28 family amino/carboxypeptidase